MLLISNFEGERLADMFFICGTHCRDNRKMVAHPILCLNQMDLFFSETRHFFLVHRKLLNPRLHANLDIHFLDGF